MVKNWVNLPGAGYYELRRTPSDGLIRYRTLTLRNCIQCGGVMLSRNLGPSQHCSKHCANLSRVPSVPCPMCGTPFKQLVTTRHGPRGSYPTRKKYCSKSCGARAVALEKAANVRRIYRVSRGLTELICERCAKPDGPQKLVMQFKNGNNADLRPGNLRLICPSCAASLRRGSPLSTFNRRRVEDTAARWTN